MNPDWTLDPEPPQLEPPLTDDVFKHTPLAWDIIDHVGKGETTDTPPLQYLFCHMEVTNIPPEK